MISGFITLASALMFLVVGVFSLRRALFLLIVSSPLLPYYFAIPIGGSTGQAGLAAARLSTYVLFILVVVSMILDARGWRPVFATISQNRLFIWLFISVSLARLASTVLSQPIGALFYWGDELLLSTTVLFLSIRVFLSIANIETLGRVILRVAIIIASLAFFESQVLGHHLLAGVIEIEVSTVGIEVLEGRLRNDTHRAQVLFDNTLSLAEYLLYSIGAIWFLYKPTTPRGAVSWVVIALALVGILQTAARSPFVLITATVLAYGTLQFNSRLRTKERVVFSVFLIIIALGTTAFILNFVFNFEAFLPSVEGMFFLGADMSSQASVVSRGFQFTLITQEVLSNAYGGILGEGYRSDILEDLDVRLDNYYLRLLIEGGLIAVISFILMLVTLVVNSAVALRRMRAMHLRPAEHMFFQRFFQGEIFFFSMFAFAKFFLSMNFNNYLLFLFAGALMAVNYILSQKRLLRVEMSTQPFGG